VGSEEATLRSECGRIFAYGEEPDTCAGWISYIESLDHNERSLLGHQCLQVIDSSLMFEVSF